MKNHESDLIILILKRKDRPHYHTAYTKEYAYHNQYSMNLMSREEKNMQMHIWYIYNRSKQR